MYTKWLDWWRNWSAVGMLLLILFFGFRFLVFHFLPSAIDPIVSVEEQAAIRVFPDAASDDTQTGGAIGDGQENILPISVATPIDQLPQITPPLNSHLQILSGRLKEKNGSWWEINDMMVKIPPITKVIGREPQEGDFVQFQARMCVDGSWVAATFCYDGESLCSLAPEEFGWQEPVC